MADEIIPPPLPPPLPRPPFPRAVDETTAPGLGPDAQILALQKTLRRVRGERDDALSALRDSAPPPPTRGQQAGKAALVTGKWAVLLPVIALAARAAARKWPGITELVDELLGALGL